MKELWKDIKGYEGYYQVSNLGRIKSLGREHTLNPRIRKDSSTEIAGLNFKDNKWVARYTINGVRTSKCFSIKQYGDNAKQMAIDALNKYKPVGIVRVVKEKILKQKITTNGYCEITLAKDSDKKSALVHILVAKEFIPNPDNLPQINHKNGIKIDNRVYNLEWDTQKENVYHSVSTGLTKTSDTGKKVLCATTGKIFDSSFKAAEWLNDNKFGNARLVMDLARRIRHCCKGRCLTSYDFKWKYVS